MNDKSKRDADDKALDKGVRNRDRKAPKTAKGGKDADADTRGSLQGLFKLLGGK